MLSISKDFSEFSGPKLNTRINTAINTRICSLWTPNPRKSIYMILFQDISCISGLPLFTYSYCPINSVDDFPLKSRWCVLASPWLITRRLKIVHQKKKKLEDHPLLNHRQNVKWIFKIVILLWLWDIVEPSIINLIGHLNYLKF